MKSEVIPLTQPLNYSLHCCRGTLRHLDFRMIKIFHHHLFCTDPIENEYSWISTSVNSTWCQVSQWLFGQPEMESIEKTMPTHYACTDWNFTSKDPQPLPIPFYLKVKSFWEENNPREIMTDILWKLLLSRLRSSMVQFELSKGWKKKSWATVFGLWDLWSRINLGWKLCSKYSFLGLLSAYIPLRKYINWKRDV